MASAALRNPNFKRLLSFSSPLYSSSSCSRSLISSRISAPESLSSVSTDCDESFLWRRSFATFTRTWVQSLKLFPSSCYFFPFLFHLFLTFATLHLFVVFDFLVMYYVLEFVWGAMKNHESLHLGDFFPFFSFLLFLVLLV